MENNEIMEKLMQSDVHSENQKNASAREASKGGDSHLSKIRVVTAKYKLLIVIFLIFICVLLINLIPNADNAYKNSKSQYDTKKQELITIESDIRVAKENMELLTGIVYNENHIKTCLNKGNSDECSSLPEKWYASDGQEDGENDEDISILEKYNLRIPLSYLQTHSLYNEKMDVDEKAILKNLNEYLIRPEMSGRETVGQLLKISIGDPEVLGYNKKGVANYFEVPVDVEIEFSTIDDLINFLYNVEKKIIDKGEDRILYKIQSVSYDIIANDEPQITDISMIAYYYYDTDFWEKDEESGKLREINEYKHYFESDDVSNDDSNTDSSDKESKKVEKESDDKGNETSFLDKIFN